MIIPMQKVILLVLDDERVRALEALREAGVMHLSVDRLEEHDDRLEINSRLTELEQVINILGAVKVSHEPAGSIAGTEAFARARAALTRREELLREEESLVRAIEQLSIWGEFDRRELNALGDKGVFVYLCEAPKVRYMEIAASYPVVKLIGENGANCAFVVCSDRSLEADKLPLAGLPSDDRPLSEFKSALEKTRRELRRAGAEIKKAAMALPALKAYADEVADSAGLLTARDAMQKHGVVCTISGFVPDPGMDSLKAAAETNGWAYIAKPADRSDPEVPTLVKMPGWVKVVRPLFNFLGISPGYNEVDASPIILVFFTIFFGILIGDAGYGALFLALSLPLAFKLKGASRTASAFIGILSVSAIVWGILTNNYFGCSIRGWNFCPALASAADKDANVQFLCFILGLIQLSLGHFWRMAVDGRWRNVASQLGWLCMMTANFFLIRTLIVYPESTHYPEFMKYLYVSGIVLVAAFEVNWTDPGSIMGFPFSLINSFVDLLSYIRLFAVGMAGFYLAYNFNEMAVGMMTGPAGIAAGVAILLVGHLLNIALCILAVLVHGVRLNTLEFSSHIGLQWSGVPFKPFAKDHNADN